MTPRTYASPEAFKQALEQRLRVAREAQVKQRLLGPCTAQHLGVEADKVTTESSFIDDLGADSLDTVELVMAFEEEFGVEIPDDAAEKILTVKDAIGFIEANAAA